MYGTLEIITDRRDRSPQSDNSESGAEECFSRQNSREISPKKRKMSAMKDGKHQEHSILKSGKYSLSGCAEKETWYSSTFLDSKLECENDTEFASCVYTSDNEEIDDYYFLRYPETEDVTYSGFDEMYKNDLRVVETGISDHYRCTTFAHDGHKEIQYKEFYTAKFVSTKKTRERWITTVYQSK
eukprot:UN24884